MRKESKVDIYQIGISHKTATVAIREQLAFSDEEKEEFLGIMKQEKSITECVLLTTCNRTEIYLKGSLTAGNRAMELLAEYKNLELKSLKKYFLRYEGEGAVKHLFRVTSGLDSLVIGEDEILGQVKRDYEAAFEHGCTGYLLNTLFREAIACSKAVKTDTKLSKTSVSVGTLTAKEVIAFQGGKKVLIIGITGKMGSIIMKNLYSSEDITITGTVRSHMVTEEMCRYPKVQYVDYNLRYEALKEADIIISATQSPHYTVTLKELENVITDKKKRLFIDLAVPRDIDKEIEGIPGITLFDMDYFEELARVNNRLKEAEAVTAGEMIEKRVEEFIKSSLFHDFLPRFEAIEEELKDTPLKTLLFKLKEHISGEELGSLLTGLERIAEEQKPYGRRKEN